ncbi:K02A2.6-like [Cordylochernes scorpioides]|uniref:K02A2.6-like n=1 Tax=Cordylochernes scorpioides TaxID=51811 RepID=A0ABY6LIG7_9ARAC|nr:K02A2.6-like [Cordylochernes scorpioides]
MFSEGRKDVNDEERAGRPSTSTTDEKINEVEKLILANRRITVREVAEDLNISIGSCHSIFINDLGMRRVAAKFVPKLLNCDQKQHRMNIANEMLDSVRDDPNLLQRVITGDEAWVYGYDVETKAQSSQWKLPHEPRPKKARQVRSNVKVLLTVFFDCRGVVHHEFLPQGRTVNKEYYLQVMRNLREAIRQKRPDLWKNKNWLLHHDNAPAHTSLLWRFASRRSPIPLFWHNQSIQLARDDSAELMVQALPGTGLPMLWTPSQRVGVLVWDEVWAVLDVHTLFFGRKSLPRPGVRDIGTRDLISWTYGVHFSGVRRHRVALIVPLVLAMLDCAVVLFAVPESRRLIIPPFPFYVHLDLLGFLSAWLHKRHSKSSKKPARGTVKSVLEVFYKKLKAKCRREKRLARKEAIRAVCSRFHPCLIQKMTSFDIKERIKIVNLYYQMEVSQLYDYLNLSRLAVVKIPFKICWGWKSRTPKWLEDYKQEAKYNRLDDYMCQSMYSVYKGLRSSAALMFSMKMTTRMWRRLLMNPDKYPLPTIPQLLDRLRGGRVFTKLDMAQAYQQLKVDETSAEILAINTPRGLYKVKRLPFGLNSAVGTFQRFVDTLLSGIDGVAVYLDDVLISGRDCDDLKRKTEKALARGLCWWPSMDKDIEKIILICRVCLSCGHDPPKTNIYPWIWPSRPWSRLHIDHAGPFQGKLFLVAVDAYSKWIEAKIVASKSAETTVNTMREMFATHGLPDVIVTDNGTSFTSEVFKTFLKRNGIRHIFCAPYHTASNGQVERAIQTFKNLLRKNSRGNWSIRLARSLLTMRIAVNGTTWKSPAQLLMNRNLKTIVDKFHPESISEGRNRQEDKFTKNWKPHREVEEGQEIMARGYHGSRWLPGVVSEKTGPVSIKVETEDGKLLSRHLDQVRICGESEALPFRSSTPQVTLEIERPPAVQETDSSEGTPKPVLRRSLRIRKPPSDILRVVATQTSKVHKPACEACTYAANIATVPKGIMHSPCTERSLFGPSRLPLWSGSMGVTNQPTGVSESSWQGC